MSEAFELFLVRVDVVWWCKDVSTSRQCRYYTPAVDRRAPCAGDVGGGARAARDSLHAWLAGDVVLVATPTQGRGCRREIPRHRAGHGKAAGPLSTPPPCASRRHASPAYPFSTSPCTGVIASCLTSRHYRPVPRSAAMVDPAHPGTSLSIPAPRSRATCLLSSRTSARTRVV
jgi:hypothetical protein